MLEKGKYKVVNYPIQVPCGDYCWTGEGPICGFLDNTGGHPTCALNFSGIIRTPEGYYKKAKRCRDLEER